ncbi:hypothetical protein [Salidesulfovibrio brasiliensis]
MSDSLRRDIREEAAKQGIDEEAVEAALAGLPEIPGDMSAALEAVLDYLGRTDETLDD